MKPKTTEGKGIERKYYVHRDGNFIYIQHSKTDSSGIGFTLDMLDGLIVQLQEIQADLAVNHPTHH